MLSLEGWSSLCPSHRALPRSLCQPHWSFILWTCQAHSCFRAWVPAVPSTPKCSLHIRYPSIPHRLSFSLAVPSSERPSWSTHYNPCHIIPPCCFVFFSLSLVTCEIIFSHSLVKSFVSWFSDHFSFLYSLVVSTWTLMQIMPNESVTLTQHPHWLSTQHIFMEWMNRRMNWLQRTAKALPC